MASLALNVSSNENPDRVLALLKQLAAEVRADDTFKDVVLRDPDVLGVDKINGREVTYPINVRVQANQRDGVLRELRRRILLAFARERIELGAAANFVILERSDPTAAPGPVV